MTLAPTVTLDNGVALPRVVLGVFQLPAEEMARLDALEEGLVTGWAPRSAP